MSAHDPAARPRSAAEALAELDPTRMLPPSEALAATEPLPTDATPEAARPKAVVGAARPRFALKRSHAIAAAAALIALLVVVIVAANSGGGSALDVTRTTTVQPAPAGAPVSQQLDQLEKIVRAAPQRR
jgi:hypothetical protein